MTVISERQPLDSYLGKNISEICANGYIENDLNHCAHFVAHVLGLSVGYTCRAQTGGKEFGACIRVQQLFEHCTRVGTWASKPDDLTGCLVFITHASNVDIGKKKMINHPRKHVGIFLDGNVTHYSNTMDRVTRQPIEQFGHHYEAPHNALFYGKVLAPI